LGDLERFRRNIYSQNGEDGVLAEIGRRLRWVGAGWFCEFGAWDGRYGSNCYALLRQGWDGVMIEGDPDRFVRLQQLARKWPQLIAIERFIEPDPSHKSSLDHVLGETPVPHDFEVLSVDIDGADYQVWQGLTRYRPQVVVIEIESSLLPGARQIHDEAGATMTSFTSMLELGRAKGYSLVCHTGNMIFVRDDLLPRLHLPSEDIEQPELLFDDVWTYRDKLIHFRRKLRNLTARRLAVKIDNAVAERWGR
jgi:hypothetical protein